MRWRLEAGSTADLRGPNACELLDAAGGRRADRAARSGPAAGDADPDRAWHRIHRSTVPIAALLMDQAVLAGVGNVYRAEVLFRNEVAPMTAGRRITRKRWDAMWADLVELMRDGVRTGRIDTVGPSTSPRRWGARRGPTTTGERSTSTAATGSLPGVRDARTPPGPRWEKPVLVPDLSASWIGSML